MQTPEQTAISKNLFLAEYRQNLGMIADACRRADICRATYYLWMKSDPDFAQACDDVQEELLDFSEQKLQEHIKKGNIIANIFHLKTKAKRRGYVERNEITGGSGGPLNVTFNVGSKEEQDALDKV